MSNSPGERTCTTGGQQQRRRGAASGRVERERRTVTAMISLYCRKRHSGSGGGLCDQCGELLNYAMRRLERCLFGDNKPTCARCPVHCYKPGMREEIKRVMRTAGPWMLLYHPILALRHQLDNARCWPEPQARERRQPGDKTQS